MELTGKNIKSLVELFKIRAQCFQEFNPEILAQSNRILRDGIVTNIIRNLKALSKVSPDGNENGALKDTWNTATRQSEILFYICYGTQLLDNEILELILLVKILSERIDTSKLDPESCDSDVLVHTLVNIELALIRALQQTERLISRDTDYSSLDQLRAKADYNSCTRKDIGSKDWQGVSEAWLCVGARGLACLTLAIYRQPEAEEDDRAANDVKALLVKASMYKGYSYIRECILPIIHGIALIDYSRSLMMMDSIVLVLSSLSKIFVMGQYRGSEIREDFVYELFYQRPDLRHHHVKTVEDYDTFSHFLKLLSDFLEVYPSFATNFWSKPDANQANGLQGFADDSIKFHPFLTKCIDMCGYFDQLHSIGVRLIASLARGGSTDSAQVIYTVFSDKLLWRWCLEIMDRAYDILGKSDDDAGLAPVMDIAGNGLKVAINKAMQMSTVFKQNIFEPEILRPDDIVNLNVIVQLFSALCRHAEVAGTLVDDFQLIDRLFVFISSAIAIDVKASALDCLRSICRHERKYVEKVWQLCEEYSLFPSRSFGSGAADKGYAWEFAEIEVRSERFPMTMSFLSLLVEMLKFGIPNDLGSPYRIPGIAAYVDFVVDEVLLKAQSRLYDRSLEEVDSLGQRWKVTSLALEVVQVVLSSYPLEKFRDGALDEDIMADFVDQDALYSVDRKEILTARQKSPGFVILASIFSNSQLMELLMNVVVYLDQQYIENQTVEFIGALLSSTKSKLFNDYSIDPMYMPGSALVALDSASSNNVYSRIKSMSNATLQRTNSIFWIERTLAATLWILNDVVVKEEVFFKAFELNGRPIVIQKRDQGRLVQTPVTPTSLSSILVGNDAVLSLIYLVTQRFSYLPANPAIELLALRLVQYVVIKSPEYMLCPTRMSDHNRRKVHNLTDIIQKFDGILLSDPELVVQLNDQGEYPILIDRSFTTPLLWSLATTAVEDNGHAVRAEILNLFLKALQPTRGNLVQQLLGFDLSGQEEFTPRKPCLQSVITLLNPRGHQLLLQSPAEAVDCYELVYRLCASEVGVTQTLQQLRDHTVDYFHTQFSFFVLIIQNRQRIALDVTAFDNAFAWFLKTLSLEIFQRIRSDETEVVAQLLQSVFSGADGVTADSHAFYHLLATVQTMAEQVGQIPMVAGLPMEVSVATTRDAKGGVGFGALNNPFRRQGGMDACEPPEFCAMSIQDAIVSLQTSSSSSEAQPFGHKYAENVEHLVQVLTSYNSGKRQIAALQHLAMALKQMLEICFFTASFSVVQHILGYDGVNDLLRDFVIPVLHTITAICDCDHRLAEEFVDVVVITVQSMERWTGGTVRLSTLNELAKVLFQALQTGSSRGSAYHAKIALALMHLRRFLLNNARPPQSAGNSSSHHNIVEDASSEIFSSIWMYKGDANVVIERLLDVAVLNPIVRYQIIALNFMKTFYEDMLRTDDFRGKDLFTRYLLSRRQLGNVLRSVFPLNENQIDAKVELLSAFNDLVACICEDLPADLLDEATAMLAIVAEKHDFEHLQLQLSYGAAESNELLVKQRKVSLLNGFLSVVSVLTHVMNCVPYNHLLLDLALKFYQRNAQTCSNILRMQSHQPALLLTKSIEQVTAFFAAVTAKSLAATAAGGAGSAYRSNYYYSSSSSGSNNNNGQRATTSSSSSWTDVWGPGSEIILMDIFKVLQILGDVGMQQGFNSYTADPDFALSFSGSELLPFVRLLGNIAETLVFREDNKLVSHPSSSSSSSSNAAGGEQHLAVVRYYQRAAEVVRCAEHCSVFLRVVTQSTSSSLKSSSSGGGHHHSSSNMTNGGSSVLALLPMAELLLRVIAIPAVTGWIHNCLEAMAYLSKETSQSRLIEYTNNNNSSEDGNTVHALLASARSLVFSDAMSESLCRIVENLTCVVYSLVHLHTEVSQLKTGHHRERVALELRGIQAIENLMRDSLVLPANSFTRVVVRWLKELAESG